MKRFLSIVLALAMLITFIPSAFAEEAAESGVRVKYVFNYSLSKPAGYSAEKFVDTVHSISLLISNFPTQNPESSSSPNVNAG